MGRHLVLVADSSYARLLEKKGSTLELLGAVYEREEMMNNFDLGASKPGRIKVASGTHTYAPKSNVHRVEKEQFVREVAKHLNNGHSDMESLVLIAPPQTLGELRKLLDPNVLAKVEHEIHKDLTKVREDELMEYVSKPYQ